MIPGNTCMISCSRKVKFYVGVCVHVVCACVCLHVYMGSCTCLCTRAGIFSLVFFDDVVTLVMMSMTVVIRVVIWR